ncbi:thiamine-phosphate diphosphorylase [Pseudovibrio denitrificans]|uniref:Thiamine-phosphate synthase n=1 Tax=Pseudovibrio denitrificans TaxID=258256 RepID=A0A1I7CT90_9HYPH|nr:thiamine phosphate synthase [Pseudovibrio denitrificans]SFU02638.1 thiamine-phosphate diphosphorylase [Pseudovibrio denitrificans]
MERFYLITGDVDWIEKLVPHGVKLVQLRIKDQPETEVRRQVIKARDFCKAHSAQLIINDYWELALELSCDFIHLGQEDMDTADFTALRKAGIRFGLSTHDEAELDRALSHNPEYVALGPVYPTKLKKMKWAPQGLDRIRRWKQMVGETPLVAIGGLTPERLAGVFEAGADSAAVVTDILQAPDPVARTQEWAEACRL